MIPGEYIQYKITVTNPSAVGSSTVSVSDPIAAQLTYDSNTTDAAGWTINYAASTVTADLSGSLAPPQGRHAPQAFRPGSMANLEGAPGYASRRVLDRECASSPV